MIEQGMVGKNGAARSITPGNEVAQLVKRWHIDPQVVGLNLAVVNLFLFNPKFVIVPI